MRAFHDAPLHVDAPRPTLAARRRKAPEAERTSIRYTRSFPFFSGLNRLLSTRSRSRLPLVLAFQESLFIGFVMRTKMPRAHFPAFFRSSRSNTSRFLYAQPNGPRVSRPKHPSHEHAINLTRLTAYFWENDASIYLKRVRSGGSRHSYPHLPPSPSHIQPPQWPPSAP
jgi:hypothetical protein